MEDLEIEIIRFIYFHHNWMIRPKNISAHGEFQFLGQQQRRKQVQEKKSFLK